MDIRHSFHKLFLIIILFCVQYGLSIIPDEDYFDEPQFNRCPWIRNKLKNGRVRYRYKGRVAKFLCDSGFELAGKRSSTCVRGQWSNPVPVCVARGCPRVPSISNGRITEMYRGALLVYDCNPGYMLDGSPTIHCDGRRWNTSPPFCVIAVENPETFCDFENPDLCGWSHDPNHDFDWQRNQFSTPSGHVGTGPAFDHTFGENKGGFYLYIEASSPRKRNDTARLFSPVYPQDKSGGCFIFWYHMYGATTGGLRVYLKPESHVFDELKPNWEKYGDQGNQWLKGHMIVPVLHENFQIVIEGLRGESYVGDSAIDDVRLTTNLCDSDDNSTDITEAVDQYSCRGRCQESGSESSCGCNANCVDEPNFCCRDYYTICTTGNFTTAQHSDEPLPDDYSTSSLTASKSTTITTPENTEETTEITPLPATEKLETTDETFSNSSNTLASSSISESTHAFTTITSTIPVSPSIYNITSTSYFSSTDPTFSPQTISSTLLKTESSTASVTSMETTSITITTFQPTSKTTSTASSLKTTFSSSTAEQTSTSRIKTTLPATKVEITSPTTKTTPQTTSTIASILLSTENQINLNISSTTPVFINDLTTAVKSASSYATDFNTTSSSEATSLDTEPTKSTTTILTSTTTLSSTRKPYNFRPRNRTSSTTMSTTVSITPRTAATVLTSFTPLYEDTSLSSRTTSSRFLTSWYRYSVSPTTKQQSTPSLTKPTRKIFLPVTSTRTRYVSDTTTPYSSKTTKLLDLVTKPTKSSLPKTSNFYESGASKTETSSSKSSLPVVISIIIVIFICLIAGLAYYIRRQRSKRQSKLSDDSEMRFLQESDYMDYSDSSALDKILVK